jgi:hypothetical protein
MRSPVRERVRTGLTHVLQINALTHLLWISALMHVLWISAAAEQGGDLQVK